MGRRGEGASRTLDISARRPGCSTLRAEPELPKSESIPRQSAESADSAGVSIPDAVGIGTLARGSRLGGLATRAPIVRAAICRDNAGHPLRDRTTEEPMPIDGRHPKEIRADIRAGKLAGVTSGLAPGFVQANLAILPRESAYDFLLFCQRNPRPCPLIEVTDVGSPEPVGVAPGPDLRTDGPRYRIDKDGVVADEVTDITPFWRDDLVSFLLGCSFTFEWALLDAGIPMRHIDEGKNVAMWKTSITCRPAGRFHGPMVVSMRPVP